MSGTWKSEFRWLEETDGDGMVCTLCRKFSRRSQTSIAGIAIWVDVPCRTIRRSALLPTRRVKVTVKLLRWKLHFRCPSRVGIERALDTVVSAQRKAFIAALKCIYFLNKREIAHATYFMPLLDLAKSLGVQ